MRQTLQQIAQKRMTFLATFSRYGSKRGWKGRTVVTLLFVDIRSENGERVADHLWFTEGLQFKRLDLKPGESILFDARSAPYQKGYRGRREEEDLPLPSIDYCLKNPTNFRRQNQNPNLFGV